MKKKIIISENQLKYLIDYVSLNEQDSKSNTFRVGDIRVGTGMAGLSRDEIESEKNKDSDDQIGYGKKEFMDDFFKLFTEKFVSDIGKQTAFKRLTSDIKEGMMNAWFNVGGLPEDFFRNIDEYKFVIKPYQDKFQIIASASNKDDIKKIEKLDTIYKQLNENNFNSYNGESNVYSMFQTSKGSSKPIFDGSDPMITQINLDGYKLLIIAPASGDQATEYKKTLGRENEITITTNPIPLNFAVESSNLSSGEVKKLTDSLFDFFNKNEKMKYAIDNKIGYTIRNIKVISSASNTWAGRTLPFTHDNNGNLVNSRYDNSVPNATRNINLARDRGNQLANLIRNNENLSEILKIDSNTTFEVNPIITDTNGNTDEFNRTNNSNLNVGQYAKFVFTIQYTESSPGKEEGKISLKNWVVEITKQKSPKKFANLFSINFSKKKYLKMFGDGFKSSSAIARNVKKPFSGLGSFLDSILP